MFQYLIAEAGDVQGIQLELSFSLRNGQRPTLSIKRNKA